MRTERMANLLRESIINKMKMRNKRNHVTKRTYNLHTRSHTTTTTTTWFLISKKKKKKQTKKDSNLSITGRHFIV